MLGHVADEGCYAHAAGEKERRRVGFHREAVAEGTPYPDLVVCAQVRHLLCAAANDLEKADEVLGADEADAEGPPPGVFQTEGFGTYHNELARFPFRPVWARKPQGEEAPVAFMLTERNKIENCQFAAGSISGIHGRKVYVSIQAGSTKPVLPFIPICFLCFSAASRTDIWIF